MSSKKDDKKQIKAGKKLKKSVGSGIIVLVALDA